MKTFKCSCWFMLSVVIFVNADGITEHKELREKCRDETKLTDGDIKMSSTISSDLGCYFFCFLKDLNVMDDNGNFDPAAAIDAMDETLREASKPEIYACYDQHKDTLDGDGCKTALKLVTCFKERAQNLYEMTGILEPEI